MKLFVYGTLKRNQYFHDRYLGGDKATYIGDVVTGPDYTLYTDGLPHLIKETTGMPCKGELYEIDDPKLLELDNLEGHPVVYCRDLIDVYTESGEKVLAWAYLRHKNFKGKKWAWPVDKFE